MTERDDTLRLSAALLNARDDLRRHLGALYDETLRPWRLLIHEVCGATGKTSMAVAMEIIVQDRLLGSSTQWKILAAAVDVAEHQAAPGGPT